MMCRESSPNFSTQNGVTVIPPGLNFLVGIFPLRQKMILCPLLIHTYTPTSHVYSHVLKSLIMEKEEKGAFPGPHTGLSHALDLLRIMAVWSCSSFCLSLIYMAIPFPSPPCIIHSFLFYLQTLAHSLWFWLH